MHSHIEKKMFLQFCCIFLTLFVTLLDPREQEILSFESGNALRKFTDVIHIINNFFFSSRVSAKDE